VTYTINGKEWTEVDINKRCAEIQHPEMVFRAHTNGKFSFSCKDNRNEGFEYDPCKSWSDAGQIIEKCWDELMAVKQCADKHQAEWEQTGWGCIMEYHNCTKLRAACICLIESNK
jgi:hypothetical protein